MDFLSLLIVSSLAAIIPGEIGRISIQNIYGGITILDLFTLSSLLFAYPLLFLKNKKVFLPKNSFSASLVIFIMVAVSSSVLSLKYFSPTTVLSGSLFLFRFIAFAAISILTFNSIKKSKINNYLNLLLVIGFLFSFIGLLQYILFADLTFLIKYGWDPHQSRIVSTLLDPNYAGFLFVCFALLSLSGYLFSGKLLNLILFLIFSVSLILTFSRSSYIAFLIGLIIIGVLKSPKIIIYATVVSLLVFLTIPKAKVRIVGALTFDETSQARIESWRNAILVFKSSPVFGVGFNNYRFAQYRLGLFDSDAGLKVHSSGGSDSSLLFVAATTGIVGLLAYCFFLMVIILNLLKNARSSAVKLASASSFIALLVHSQFVNSLFFPPIMIVYFFMLGLSFVHDS